MRLGAVALLAAVALSCSTPPADSPSPSAAAASASSPPSGAAPTSAPGTSPPATGETRVQLDDSTHAASADGEVLIVTRALPGATRIEAIDLATRARSVVREFPAPGVSVTSVRDGVIAFTVIEDGLQAQTARMRVFAGRWRDPTTITQLDDFVIDVFGGDSWNPWPLPETNGWEIVWMRAHREPTFYELVMRDEGGKITSPYISNVPFTFSLSRTGEIAVAEIASATDPPARVALRVWSPRGGMRDVVDRPAVGGSGYVKWSGGKIAWSNGLGLVQPMRSVEVIDPANGARETVSNPGSCFGYAGATDAQLSFLCGDHLEFARGPGPARVGPPVPLVHARAIIRTVPGPPPVAFVTPVITNDPRPGTGARF